MKQQIIVPEYSSPKMAVSKARLDSAVPSVQWEALFWRFNVSFPSYPQYLLHLYMVHSTKCILVLYCWCVWKDCVELTSPAVLVALCGSRLDSGVSGACGSEEARTKTETEGLDFCGRDLKSRKDGRTYGGNSNTG